MLYILLCLISLSYFVHAQQGPFQNSTEYRRGSISSMLPNRYFDRDARRISIAITQTQNEDIGQLPDIEDIPVAFCDTPHVQSALIIATHIARQQKRGADHSSPKSEQKKSLVCCTIM